MSVELVKPFGLEFLEEIMEVEVHGKDGTFDVTGDAPTRTRRGQILLGDPDEIND